MNYIGSMAAEVANALWDIPCVPEDQYSPDTMSGEIADRFYRRPGQSIRSMTTWPTKHLFDTRNLCLIATRVEAARRAEMTAAEVVEYLMISRSTLDRWLKDRGFPPARYEGRKRMFEAEAVKQFKESKKHKKRRKGGK
jgi:excisionase family DNA binding protein